MKGVHFPVACHRGRPNNPAFGSIDAMFKKRHDLIPNLASAVKEYMSMK
ncbi:MAG TPA: hypothetical protein ENK09_06700 [Nitrospirae bacterium]|nr:hypothetical protein [Nitrospirota bacterium]